MITYRKLRPYRYQLTRAYTLTLPWGPEHDISVPFLYFSTVGTLHIQAGYAWDGASGACDTQTILRASLVHDALYQLLRERHLPLSARSSADQTLYTLCREDGMCWLRAAYIYGAVRLCGGVLLSWSA